MENVGNSGEVSGKNILWKVIGASSVGTLIEWYDFYIFGSLATILSSQFFPRGNPTAAFLSTLATFAAGFIVRPFGALVFGRLGDLVGRKHTFLLTLLLMGGSTFVIGMVPSFDQIGYIAPVCVLLLRLIQGLALGGEYGGAATYVAEHAPSGRRGYYTGFIQTTATLGLFLSLGVILITRQVVGLLDFAQWGWRVPFLLSAILVVVSVVIRLKMQESPLFAKVKAEGKVVKNPLKESFGKKSNLKMVLLALFGATAGQGVVWYTGQFYALSFIQKAMKVEFAQSNYILALALLIGTPFFILFGGWSDKIGRRNIMLAGMALAIVLYRPVYRLMYRQADMNAKKEVPSQRSYKTETNINAKEGQLLITKIKDNLYVDGTILRETRVTKQSFSAGRTRVEARRAGSGVQEEVKQEVILPPKGFWTVVLLVAVQVLLVTMVYGPIAAFLVELFPVHIRYTSMSLPYHIGNGVFGGLTPFIATSLTSLPGATPFDGLWYPIGVAGICLIIGVVYIDRNTGRNY